ALGKKAARERLPSMLAAVGFQDPERIARSYPHQLSGGMAQRTLLALAVGLSPKLLIADEPTSGLDATVQVEVLNMMSRLVRDQHMSMLLITHDFGVVARYCDTVAVMYGGRIVERAEAHRFFAQPAHPYSIRLLSSLGWSGATDRLAHSSSLRSVPGVVSACNYAPRCPLALARCIEEEPQLTEVAEGHDACCHRSRYVMEMID